MNSRLSPRSPLLVLARDAGCTRLCSDPAGPPWPGCASKRRAPPARATPVNPRAPALTGIQQMTPSAIREVISDGGIMAPMASSLSGQEKTDLIAWLTAGQGCDTCLLDRRHHVLRRQEGRQPGGHNRLPGLRRRQEPDPQLHLRPGRAERPTSPISKCAWAIAFPGQGAGTGASVLSDGTIFITGGQKVAGRCLLGCLKWTYAGSSRNTPAIGESPGRKVVAVSIGRDIHVLDAATGAPRVEGFRSAGQRHGRRRARRRDLREGQGDRAAVSIRRRLGANAKTEVLHRPWLSCRAQC